MFGKEINGKPLILRGNESEHNVMYARVLKNRWLGDTGIASTLIYNPETGRLTEGEFDE